VAERMNGGTPNVPIGAVERGSEPSLTGSTRAAVILPWERRGRDVAGGDQPRAAEARLAEAIGLAMSIGLVVLYEAILPLRVRRKR